MPGVRAEELRFLLQHIELQNIGTMRVPHGSETEVKTVKRSELRTDSGSIKNAHTPVRSGPSLPKNQLHKVPTRTFTKFQMQNTNRP